MGATKIKDQQFEYLGKHLLLEKIAAGGMAEVWLAQTQTTQGVSKFIAVKKILSHLTDDAEFISMFRQEASIVVNLSHSNIVSIYEFSEDNGRYFISMDYVEGQNLHGFLRKICDANITLSEEQSMYIAKEIACGLSYAHMAVEKSTGKPLGIIHRDVTPQNIMIGYNGEIKIIDFGVAKITNQLEATRKGSLKGKLGYMSPEQVAGMPIDSRSDIFSLGICMWELATKRKLFSGASEYEYVNKIMTLEIPLPSTFNLSVAAEFERIIMKALDRNLSDRYQSADEIHRDLAGHLNRYAPDFAAADFARFVQLTNQKEYRESRERLIRYSVHFKELENSAQKEKIGKTKYGTPAEPINKYVKKEPRKFPFKLLFLFALLLKAFLMYSIEYQKIVLASLPDKLKPVFLRVVDPFLDLRGEEPSVPIPKVDVEQAAQPSKPDPKKFVNIDGQFYEFSPTGIYIINGHKVYFKVKRP